LVEQILSGSQNKGTSTNTPSGQNLSFFPYSQVFETTNWQEIQYYCEASKNSHLTFHKGDKSAEVFAEGDTQQATPGTTTITYILPQESGSDSPTTTFDLDHFHHKLPSLHGKTTFTYNGKEYTWKGHSELVDSENNILAMFFPSWFDGLGQKIGRLEILERGKGMLDVIVVSAMVVQERTDEHKQAAENARERAAKAGIPFFWP
jgi:hypothetical protein